MVRSGKQPLVQVTKRLAERQWTERPARQSRSTSKLTANMPDNCVFLMDNTVGFIQEKRNDGTLRMDVFRETDCECVFEKACNSKLFKAPVTDMIWRLSSPALESRPTAVLHKLKGL